MSSDLEGIAHFHSRFGESCEQVHLVAWALRRAILRTDSYPTLQEGLYEAYSRDLRWLGDLGAVPSDLHDAIERVVCPLCTELGFDAVTGTKIAPSTLGNDRAVALLAQLRNLSEKVTAAATHA